jgi:hypothetical protein
MVRIDRWQTVLFPICLALAACSTKAPKPQAYSPAPQKAVAAAQSVAQPVLKVGQKWAFRRIDLWRNNDVQERFEQELVMNEGDQWTVQWRIVFSNDPQRRGSITGEYLDAKSQSFFDPKMLSPLLSPHIPLSFPLQVGKTWSFSYGIVPEPGRVIQIDQTAIVEGWESVTVPAGTFRALKIVHRGRYSAQESIHAWSGNIQETYWYAPDALRVVKMEYRDTNGDGRVFDQRRDELTSMKL